MRALWKPMVVGAIFALATTAPVVGGTVFKPKPSLTPPQQPQQPMSSLPVGGGVSHLPRFVPLPAPTNLTATNDVQTCSAHGGFAAGLVCKALLPKGTLVLIWNYPANIKVSGFRIRMIVPYVSADTMVNAPGVTLYAVDPPPTGGAAMACYSVSAVIGARESPSSPVYCGNQAPLIQSLTLKPYMRSNLAVNVTKMDMQYQNMANILVGYAYQANKMNLAENDYYLNEIARLGLLFDTSPLAGRRIYSARLKAEVYRTWRGSILLGSGVVGDTPAADHETSCVAKVFEGAPRDRWWKNSDWIEAGALVTAPGLIAGPDISIDVTRVVQGWASGRDNMGLVMQGEEENFTAFTDGGCMTEYFADSVVLEVLYY